MTFCSTCRPRGFRYECVLFDMTLFLFPIRYITPRPLSSFSFPLYTFFHNTLERSKRKNQHQPSKKPESCDREARYQTSLDRQQQQRKAQQKRGRQSFKNGQRKKKKKCCLYALYVACQSHRQEHPATCYLLIIPQCCRGAGVSMIFLCLCVQKIRCILAQHMRFLASKHRHRWRLLS